MLFKSIIMIDCGYTSLLSHLLMLSFRYFLFFKDVSESIYLSLSVFDSFTSYLFFLLNSFMPNIRDKIASIVASTIRTI